MTFTNNKKTFLEKLDRSKKGSVDKLILPLLEQINNKDNYYTTSSCSGRVYLWRNKAGKKKDTEWLKVSHEPISLNFLNHEASGLVWLRLEPMILHVCCSNLDAANKLLILAQKQYKKSYLLSINKKIIVEIRGSEFLEMPLYQDSSCLFNDKELVVELVNKKMKKISVGLERFMELVGEIFN